MRHYFRFTTILIVAFLLAGCSFFKTRDSDLKPQDQVVVPSSLLQKCPEIPAFKQDIIQIPSFIQAPDASMAELYQYTHDLMKWGAQCAAKDDKLVDAVKVLNKQ